MMALLLYKPSPTARYSSICDSKEHVNCQLTDSAETLPTFSSHTPILLHKHHQTGDWEEQMRNQRMQGNFIEMLNIVISYFICDVCLQANPSNSSYSKLRQGLAGRKTGL